MKLQVTKHCKQSGFVLVSFKDLSPLDTRVFCQLQQAGAAAPGVGGEGAGAEGGQGQDAGLPGPWAGVPGEGVGTAGAARSPPARQGCASSTPAVSS